MQAIIANRDMQAPHTFNRFGVLRGRPFGTVPQWPPRPRSLFPSREGMDIGDILNVRNAADHMRHQMHPMRMDAYGMNHNQQTMGHQLHDPSGMYSSMGHPQHNTQLMSNHYMPSQHDSSVSFDGSDLTQKSDVKVPAKAFACSTCSKGFARRSDLARHGMRMSLYVSTTRLT